MTTAWQKAMRRGGPSKRKSWKSGSVSQIRQGTYQVEIDAGADGVFNVRLYPDGSIQSNHRLTEAEREKVKKIFLKAGV